ncbi:MAG: hypothetical protein PVG39_02065 [Desulfobacteraceae bacterium]|jgi:hypothetical protein
MIRIGIDPDIDKSGYAICQERKLTALGCKRFFDLCLTIKVLADEESEPLTVTIEAGWLIPKSNWHNAKGLHIAERISKNVGENHAVGKLLAQYCEYHGITYELKKPIGKIDQAQFKAITGWKGRTNQEQRDAAMLVYGR